MFYKKKTDAAYYMPMGCKKSRRVRKIEVSTDSVSEFELGDIVVDIQWRMQEREAREREAQQQREEEARRQEAGAKESHLQEGVAKKSP